MPLDALRLSEREQSAILCDLDEQSRRFGGSDRRENGRLPYGERQNMLVRILHVGGSRATYIVRPRNLSSTGLAFLHGSFVHVGSSCWVPLKDYTGKTHGIEGQVVRCRHVRGRVHEIAVAFVQPINLSDFVCADLSNEQDGSGSARGRRLRGSILCIESNTDERELLRFSLEALGLTVRMVVHLNDAAEAIQAELPDVVVHAAWPKEGPGPEAIRRLSDLGFSGPTIAVAPDDDETFRTNAIASGFARVIVRPYSVEELAALLSEFLVVAGDMPNSAAGRGDLVSLHWSNRAMRPLIAGFVDRLSEQIKRLDQAAREGGQEQTIARISTELKSAAMGFGYPQIAEAAQALAQAAADPPDPRRLAQFVSELLRLSMSAQRGRLAAQAMSA